MATKSTKRTPSAAKPAALKPKAEGADFIAAKPRGANALQTYPDGSLATVEHPESRRATNPTLRGAVAGIRYATKAFGDDIDLTAYANELQAKANEVQRGNLSGLEAMLATQANTLDMLFNQLARKAASVEYLTQMQAHLNLALKAQAQCRATVEALNEIKNPRPVAFVKQANVAGGHMQVNNGTQSPAPARDATTLKSANELLEQSNGEWLDTGAAGTTGRGHPALEAVGAVDRPQD